MVNEYMQMSYAMRRAPYVGNELIKMELAYDKPCELLETLHNGDNQQPSPRNFIMKGVIPVTLYRFEMKIGKDDFSVIYGLMHGIGGLLDILKQHRRHREPIQELVELENALEYVKYHISNELLDPVMAGILKDMHNTRSWFTRDGYDMFINDIDLIRNNLIPGFEILEKVCDDSDLATIIYRDRYQVVERFNDYRKDSAEEISA